MARATFRIVVTVRDVEADVGMLRRVGELMLRIIESLRGIDDLPITVHVEQHERSP